MIVRSTLGGAFMLAVMALATPSLAAPGLTGAYYLPSSRGYHIDDDGLPVPTKAPDATRVDAQIAFGAGQGFVRKGRQLVWWVPERDQSVAAVWKGFVRLPKAGTYYFTTVSDDASAVYLNQSRVALNGALGKYIASEAFRYPDAKPAPHPSRHAYAVPVPVEGPRVVPIEVRYVARNASSTHGFGIDLYWVTPDARRDDAGKPIAELIPPDALFTEPPEPVARSVVSRAHSTISSDFLYFPEEGVATLTVRLADAQGRPVPGRRVHVSGLTSYGGADTITQPEKATDANGVTTATVQGNRFTHESTFFATDLTGLVDVGQTVEMTMKRERLKVSFMPPAFSPYYDGKRFQVHPRPLRVGQRTTVSVPLVNNQKIPAELQVRLFVKGLNIGAPDWPKVAESETFTLAPGESRMVELAWTPTETAGHVCFQVEVWGTLVKKRASSDRLPFLIGRAFAATPRPKDEAGRQLLERRQHNIGPITCAIPKSTPTPTPSTPSKRGFVWGKLGGHFREKPSPSAKPVGNVVPDSRLIYTDVVYDKNGKAQWYYVPSDRRNPWRHGKPDGWISAGDVDTQHPLIPPADTKIIIKDSGLGEVKVTASVVAGCRG